MQNCNSVWVVSNILLCLQYMQNCNSVWVVSDILLCLQYMQNCNSVWVVSNIHRAVDNKIAKDLLGEHFRRQLLMDGQYSSVSFICTKTDIVNTSETIRLLFIFCVLYGYQSNRPKITAL